MTGAIALPERQRTDAWRKRRQVGIGSSDAAVIAGVSPWGDIRTLFAEKVGWAAPVIETRPMKFGIALEAVVATAYSEKTGRKVRRVRRMLRHRELPWMLASLDRVVVGEMRLVEIKTARFASEEWGADGSDEVPDHVRIQVEHQMAVTGYTLADVAVLFAGSDLRTYTIERDPDIQADLLGMEHAFWTAVQAKSLPADLTDLGPRPVPLREGEVAAEALPLPVPVLAVRVAELRRDHKALEVEKDETEAELKHLIDEYTAIRGDNFRITYRQQGDRKKIDWEQVAAAYRSMLQELADTIPGVAEHIDDRDPDTVESLFTTTSRGNRPLLITLKETTDNAPL